MIGLEGGEHFFGVVDEIQDIRRIFAGMGAVQAGKRLHRLDAGQPFVYIHPAEQRLVEAGLEFVSHQQDLIFVGLECLANVAAFQVWIERLAVLRETIRAGDLVTHLAGEGHQRSDLVMMLRAVFLDR